MNKQTNKQTNKQEENQKQNKTKVSHIQQKTTLCNYYFLHENPIVLLHLLTFGFGLHLHI